MRCFAVDNLRKCCCYLFKTVTKITLLVTETVTNFVVLSVIVG